MDISFYGVRGSTPCGCDANRRYGGNTACVALETHDGPPIVLDLGTGLRFFGLTQPLDGSFQGAALVSHLHWDHIQGLPFFTPVDRPGARFDIYAPPGEGGTVAESFDAFMCPPYFPIRASDLRGEITFHDCQPGTMEVFDATVETRMVPHIGPTNGYRIERGGVKVAYISDHQAPYDLNSVTEDALALCDGVDVLIHDAQFVEDEWEQKAHWGHCTAGYALRVARQSGAKNLVLFHHDPHHDDDTIDAISAEISSAAAGSLDSVVAAAEGLKLTFGE